MLAVFRYRHRIIFYFIGIDLVLSTESCSAGYKDQI